jgi:hypothetical protein
MRPVMFRARSTGDVVDVKCAPLPMSGFGAAPDSADLRSGRVDRSPWTHVQYILGRET